MARSGEERAQVSIAGASPQVRRRSAEVAHPGAGGAASERAVHHIAASGVSGAGAQLPHLERIQHAFGADHDVSGIEAHVGSAAGGRDEPGDDTCLR